MAKSNSKKDTLPIADHFPEFSEIRQIEIRYELNSVLTSAVKQGNFSLALQIAKRMIHYMDGLRRSGNDLFNAQYFCIILNTQLRCALENSGVPPYKLDFLSNEIAIRIGTFTNYELLEAFFEEILRQYCMLAREESVKNYSQLIRLTVGYIHAHLSDNITVKDTALALSVNADYLSHQFCLEIGIPFITYVNQTRIKQAESLLQNTTLPVHQIASVVGYNNTSYFSKLFLKYNGITPKQFRKNGMF